MGSGWVWLFCNMFENLSQRNATRDLFGMVLFDLHLFHLHFFRPSNLQVVNLRYWDAASHDIPWPTMKSKSLGSLQEGSQTQNTWEIQCKNLKCNPSRILFMDTCMVWSYSDMILRFWYADMINTWDHGETIILRSKRNELYPTPKVPFVFSRASFCSMHSLSCKLRIIEIIEPYWARQSHK